MVDGTRLGSVSSTSRYGARGKEMLSIRNENGQSALSYERTNDEEQLTIEVAGSGGRILIRRTPRGSSSALPVEFKQAANEKIALTVGSGAGQQVFRAQGVWQLLITQPQLCRQHLVPLLEMLRPDWRLADTAARIEEKLLQEVGADGAAKRGHWAALVAELADESFAKRQAADRALRADGAGAIAYLRQLDFNRLDAEQQFRVQRIIEALGGQQGDDSVDQAVAALAGDPAVWLALLGRPDSATRQTAARQLATLLGEPIAVDPAADPDSQKGKREQLRVRIEEK
jgi:hypothetical protein